MDGQKSLTRWAVEEIRSKYPGDIAVLAAVEGQSVRGDGHGECFDYFIPASPRGLGLARTFIIGEVGYDLYPRSWERMERTADLRDPATFCLAEAKLLYCRTEEDRRRFETLRERLSANLKDPEFTGRRASEQLDEAENFYRRLSFARSDGEARLAAGKLLEALALTAALLNGGWQTAWLWGGGMPPRDVPEGFLALCREIALAQDVQELPELCRRAVLSVRRWQETLRPFEKTKPAGPGLAEWYQEMKLFWHRLEGSCGEQKPEEAFFWACLLQGELSVAEEEFGLRGFDLLGAYRPGCLSELRARAAELERRVLEEAASRGEAVERYDTIEAFFEKNAGRCKGRR